jgi:hypothetical protein
MTPLTAGNPILTITRDLQATFILPTPSRRGSKRFFQSTNDGHTFGIRRVKPVTLKPLIERAWRMIASRKATI